MNGEYGSSHKTYRSGQKERSNFDSVSSTLESNIHLSYLAINVCRQPASGDVSKAGVSLNRGKSKVLATKMSSHFKVWSAKKFPGMIESTPLSKAFASQGIRIPVRHGSSETAGANGKKASEDEMEMEEG
jgi:hypothetical protein